MRIKGEKKINVDLALIIKACFWSVTFFSFSFLDTEKLKCSHRSNLKLTKTSAVSQKLSPGSLRHFHSTTRSV